MSETLRTRIPIFLCILMDRKGVKVTFGNNSDGPTISWKSKSSSGYVCLQDDNVDAYGARAIEIERELFLLLTQCKGDL